MRAIHFPTYTMQFAAMDCPNKAGNDSMGIVVIEGAFSHVQRIP
jgi:hypothetical protein